MTTAADFIQKIDFEGLEDSREEIYKVKLGVIVKKSNIEISTAIVISRQVNSAIGLYSPNENYEKKDINDVIWSMWFDWFHEFDIISSLAAETHLPCSFS